MDDSLEILPAHYTQTSGHIFEPNIPCAIVHKKEGGLLFPWKYKQQ